MTFAVGRVTHREYSRDPILAEMIAQLPGLPEALAADQDAADRAAAAMVAPIDADHAITVMLEAGKVDPKKITELARGRAAIADANGEQAILAEVRARATSIIEGSVVAASPQLLDDLDRRLQDLFDTIHPHAATLAGVASAADAIAAGPDHVAAWSAITAARTDYDALRRAQKVIMMRCYEQDWHKAARTGLNLPAEANDAIIANLDDLWPTWRATAPAGGAAARVDPAGVVRRDLVTGARLDPAPWPDDPVAQLLWFATNDVHTWIPTPKRLATLWTERKDRDLEHARELHQAARANGSTHMADKLTGAVGRPY